MESTVEFSPAILRPKPFDAQMRIQELRGYYQPEQQHINIKAAIKLYEDGEIDGVQHVFIKDGKLVTKKEIFATGGWS
ncbi:uncharacterized protein Z518_08315 [Rhinocladiella mackenziei CBS 650.93]|uniref:Rhinocladiella mackenziei CBS 650.93 unplaced genomic scaffold supercont1.6, whole genome shotgun sequence n=1 Tax=Rhinocladiella mackenziei CBS 650.93 TaxID=1442369 RepID=A0A0D2I966_9EURO|nr:uncharacterized protein Z518_08315 [Rhinocladiella mackenziei CBS 650.93]KIX02374.1 hypothetical protein Z518_08315 [Rhinocladiella mackenziei CBS 650.93]